MYLSVPEAKEKKKGMLFKGTGSQQVNILAKKKKKKKIYFREKSKMFEE